MRLCLTVKSTHFSQVYKKTKQMIFFILWKDKFSWFRPYTDYHKNTQKVMNSQDTKSDELTRDFK